MKQFYTYLYFDGSTPIWVGKGQGRRAYDHLRGNRHNPHFHNKLQKMFRNGNQPIIEIINATNEVAAFWLERCFIKAFGRHDLDSGTLLNMTDGGEGGPGTVKSDETKAKWSVIRKGRPSGFKGKSHSPETCAKMRSPRRKSSIAKYRHPQSTFLGA